MIKIFLLDDDSAVTDILKMIIEQKKLGRVCGIEHSSTEALEEIRFLQPDILIVDLLMPDIDGTAFVKRAKAILPEAAFIMLSQVSSKEMISSAYEAGVIFFIQKPINSIEVIKVIENVEQSLKMKKTVDKMTQLLSVSTAKGFEDENSDDERHDKEKKQLRNILSRMGILGENGTEDIILICEYFIDNESVPGNMTIKEICAHFSDTPKSMEQRIRRAATAGMTNLAHLGLTDYAHPDFVDFAGKFYTFEQVRYEMDFIQGKVAGHGKVKIKKFISELVQNSRTYNH